MEPNGLSSFRHRQSPSSERFLGIFSSSQPEKVNGEIAVTSAGDELDEDDVFWTGDFSESNRKSNPITITSNQSHRSSSFRRPETFGILAALPEDEKKRFTGDRSVLYRKPSFSSSSSSPLSPSPMAASSSSRMVLAIPKPPQTPQERDSSLSGPAGKFHQSAPVNVPVLSKAMAAVKAKNRTIFEVDDHDGDDEMLPPHEIVARGSRRSPMTTTSVLEGAGRTLKGRDLRQVRNAVWRQTGFLD